MTRMLLALSLFGVLAGLLPGVAQAQLWKCRDIQGKWVYQDHACEVPAPLAPVPLPPPLSREAPPTTLTDEERFCQTTGSIAADVAQARDRGAPITAILEVLHPVLAAAGAAAPILESLFRGIIYEMYDNRWWTPTSARQRMELLCLKALKPA